ncbi:PHP domain-containing protein [Clostridioides difficile]|uniref:PHP domain-containing protein n=1 Tax=Clostridioides difficile TaxID=1496 RepID=UPI000B3CF18B|nr:PHP domain-containing protein [Clostridioides difficile]
MKEITILPLDLDLFLSKLPFQNYHKHTSYSNRSTPDSGATNKDYINRALELNHTIVSSCEHGFQGNYWEVYSLIEDTNKQLKKKREKNEKDVPNDLKFIFGAEAYWVKNRHEKDRKNNHICIFAKNENGRQWINEILSEANETGYYYKPRIDLELLFKLPPEDVFITTACIGFWGYELKETINIIKELHEYFKDNFMLEVQYHNTVSQRKLNQNIKNIANKFNIKMIMGCDSHYIYTNGKEDRDYILEYKGIHYPDEDGWYMDYPSTEEAFNRFKKQGVLSDLQILNVINNTNVFLEFEDIYLNKNIKLPSLFPDKTQKEKNNIYIKIIKNNWNKYKKENNLSKEEIEKYKEGIKQEVKTVIDTKMADYFIIDYYLVKNAVEDGGIITKSGRGSSVSYFTNTLLGFSDVDRFIAPVHLYPERFMSTTRILKTQSLPDIDLNLGNPEIFEESQKKLLGEGHSYPMIAYGTLKIKSAWKMYAGANENKIDFDTANEISKQLEQYELDYNNVDDDEKDTVDVYEYIDEKYHQLFDESKKYRGIIMDSKKAPCGYLIYSGNIRREIGLIKCKSESTKKEYMVALIDGKMADKFKYLKNDLLKVDVCLLHRLTAERIGIKEMTVRQLIQKCNNDKKVWDIYKNGYTLGVNQCERKGTTTKVMKYKPTNDGELANFIAAIRPSFKTMYKTFSNRQRFSYGIKAFDDIVQTETMKDSFLIYQEQLMAALSFSGIPMDECYELIKAISKKNEELIKSYEKIFLNGFTKRILETENISEKEALENSKKVWEIINNAAKYGFNASHAYCMACDSLRDAYTKAYYPYEFYEVRLEHYSLKGKKDKVSAFKLEMEKAFGIKEGQFKFGLDNRKFTADKENKCIHPALNSIKGIGRNDAEELYKLSRNKKYNNFLELYGDILSKTKVNRGKIQKLIILDYFNEFGKTNKLIQMTKIYDNLYDRKQINKNEKGFKKLGLKESLVKKYAGKETKKLYKDLNIIKIVEEMTKDIEDKDINIKEKISLEIEYLGYPNTILSNLKSDLYYVIFIKTYKNKKSITYYPELYNIKTGQNKKWKLKDYITFSETPFKEGDLIEIHHYDKEIKKQEIDKGKWVETNEFNYVITSWEVF